MRCSRTTGSAPDSGPALAALVILAASLGGCQGSTPATAPDGDSELFVFPNSHELRIEPRQLLDLDPNALWQARNEIFARRGREFTSERGKSFFREMPYYAPTSDDVTLNEVERGNVELIARFERYAAENPDLEFESAYAVSGSGSEPDSGVAMRACPSADCELTGHLDHSCLVFGDYRMDAGEWIYARSSRCAGKPGPAGGYVERKQLSLTAG